MNRVFATLLSALTILLFAGQASATQATAVKTAPAKAETVKSVATDGPRAPAQTRVNPEDIARRHLELADVYASAILAGQQCDFEAYPTRVLENYYFAKSLQPTIAATPSILSAIGSTASFRFLADGVTGQIRPENFAGTTLFGNEMSSMIRSEVRLLAGGSLEYRANRYNTEKEDFEPVSFTGTWSLQPARGDRRNPSLVLTYNRKTKAYRIFPTSFQTGGWGLVPGNHANRFEREYRSPDWRDFAFFMHEPGGCGD